MARSRTRTRKTARSHPYGVLSMHVRGYGFVRTAEGEFFVPASKIAGAFDGDVVEIAPLQSLPPKGAKRTHANFAAASGAARSRGSGMHGQGPSETHPDDGGRPVARIVRVIERAHVSLVGRYEAAEPFGVVVPCDPLIPYDIFTLQADRPGIENGVYVRVRISEYPGRHSAATGVIEEVLAASDGESAGIDVIVSRHKLETEFSAQSLVQAREAAVDAQGALSSGYRDLRNRFVFTVDPADARDFDDALSFDPSPEGRPGAWRLGVHIADVSHYVPWGSSVDFDARRRATSVYLVDRVIPMLPHELSNDICSLVPGEARRTMTVDLYLDETARVFDYDIYPALISSNERLTYEEAQELLGASPESPVSRTECSASFGNESPHPEAAGSAERPGGLSAESSKASSARQRLSSRLSVLAAIARLRAEARRRAGGLDFSTAEAKVRLDGDGRPVSVDLRRKTAATQLVEEAMILANETVARHLAGCGFPCVYRVHGKPSLESLNALLPVLQEFPWYSDDIGRRVAAGDAFAMQEVLEASKDRAEGALVSSCVLRSMKRAVYSPENGGHYGLASATYAHFTSPIRRYPDLVVHRMLKAQLFGRPQKFDQEVSALSWIAEHSSEMERTADEAARESQEIKLIEYLERDVGRAFPAVVSGVASAGIWAQLDNTAEGFLPVRVLGDEYFSFDAARHMLIGQDTGRTFRLGQRIPIVVAAADHRTRTLDFKLANGKQRSSTKR